MENTMTMKQGLAARLYWFGTAIGIAVAIICVRIHKRKDRTTKE